MGTFSVDAAGSGDAEKRPAHHPMKTKPPRSTSEAPAPRNLRIKVNGAA
jgi:hypothetical protein